MLRAALASVIVACVAFPQDAQAVEERCGLMIQEEEGFKTEVVEGFSVSNVQAPLRLPEGYDNVVAVLCGRNSIVPLVSDFRVVTELRLPFDIHSDGRVIVLEISNGQLRARTIRGELTGAEREALRAVLNDAQLILQGQAPTRGEEKPS